MSPGPAPDDVWVLPDQIHNFAHNNEWCTRSLRNHGRVSEAVSLAKNMVGYTAKIPGTRASKAQLRRVILTMVKQIEIETASAEGMEKGDAAPGDVPSLFGTLTTQRGPRRRALAYDMQGSLQRPINKVR